MDRDQLQRAIELAGEACDEAYRCRDGGAYDAGLVMVGVALEAQLLAVATLSENELRARDLWPSQRRPRPVEEWGLAELLKLAQRAGWLETTETPTYDLDRDPLGNVAEVLLLLRNLVAHPGREIRTPTRLDFGEPQLSTALGILEATFEQTGRVVDSLP